MNFTDDVTLGLPQRSLTYRSANRMRNNWLRQDYGRRLRQTLLAKSSSPRTIAVAGSQTSMEQRCEVICLRLGDGDYIQSGPMFCAFGLARRTIALSATMVVSLANGNIGYVLTTEAIAKAATSLACRGSRSP